ncbi:methionine--tRNA ligase [Helicobacter pametensis]|uniref:methionine--tRNA ligase n=1 Tax=Helicobacter pametensis TaxID=95149 RepID=UPI0004813A15|nr:methionine--tRNA ligase [Helicobacter pametensis]
MKKYITTPIYYVNDVPHIGHAYTTIIADFLKKFYTLEGNETFLLTGTDEHGQKIEQSAKAKGKTPMQYATEISQSFKSLWDKMEISYDHFLRTTDPHHIQAVQKAFVKMQEKGDIYLGEYEGHYCISCESFFTPTQLKENGGCPDCGKPTQIIKEESYFFALSKYQDQLLKWYESNPILPSYRQNEVIAFVSQGLNDLSITRTTFEWGIPIPSQKDDQKHIIYVWLDALMNYVSALGYGQDGAQMSFWEEAIHLVGKDILRFHAIYWPAFLLSLELPLPQKIYAHGWWLNEGQKMSKSIGNVIDPQAMIAEFGNDLFRYFLLREVPFGQDGDFSHTSLIDRSNSELSNDLGNLLNRVVGMSEKYFALQLYTESLQEFFAQELENINQIIHSALQEIPQARFHRYLEEVWRLFALGNELISKYEPWNLQKNGEENKTQALLVLLCNILYKGATLIYPAIPQSAQKIVQALGKDLGDLSSIKTHYFNGFQLTKTDPLFPKIQKPEPKMPPSSSQVKQEETSLIKIDDFFLSDLRVGEVIEAKRVEGSDKLLCFQIDLGEGRLRQIISGIAKYYDPQDLIGTQVCVVANLKPAKLMGMISEGMILSVKDDEGLKLIVPQSKKKNGSKIG